MALVSWIEKLPNGTEQLCEWDDGAFDRTRMVVEMERGANWIVWKASYRHEHSTFLAEVLGIDVHALADGITGEDVLAARLRVQVARGLRAHAITLGQLVPPLATCTVAEALAAGAAAFED